MIDKLIDVVSPKIDISPGKPCSATRFACLRRDEAETGLSGPSCFPTHPRHKAPLLYRLSGERLYARFRWARADRLRRMTNLRCPSKIELTAPEQALLEKIAFPPTRDHDAVRASLDPAEALTRSLCGRNAIPEARLRWFQDPECNPGGRGKSREQLFEQGSSDSESILRHPNFLRRLHYFIFGPALPVALMERFCDAIHFQSGDLEPLRKLARELTREMVRQHSRNAFEASEEFYKLALECGLSTRFAESIGKTARTVK